MVGATLRREKALRRRAKREIDCFEQAGERTGTLGTQMVSVLGMIKLRSVSPAVAIAAALAGVTLGVLGSNLYRAQYASVPLPTAYTAPQLQQSPTSTEGLVTVEAYVDSNGRVEGYRLLSDASGAKSLSSKVKNMLIFTTFRPATFMGKPTRGTATLVFSLAGLTTSAPSVERQ